MEHSQVASDLFESQATASVPNKPASTATNVDLNGECPLVAPSAHATALGLSIVRRGGGVEDHDAVDPHEVLIMPSLLVALFERPGPPRRSVAADWLSLTTNLFPEVHTNTAPACSGARTH